MLFACHAEALCKTAEQIEVLCGVGDLRYIVLDGVRFRYV